MQSLLLGSLCVMTTYWKKIKSRVLSEPFRQKFRQFSNIVFLFERLITEKLNTGYINYNGLLKN